MNVFKKTNSKGFTFFDYLRPNDAEHVRTLIVKDYKLKRAFQRSYRKYIVWKKRHPRGRELYYSIASLYAGRIDKRLVELNVNHYLIGLISLAFHFWISNLSVDIFIEYAKFYHHEYMRSVFGDKCNDWSYGDENI